jgi:hypothetical protein
MSNETFDPAVASGETAVRGVRSLELNEVSLNGDGSVTETAPGKYVRKGGHFRKRLIVGAPKDTKPEEVQLGDSVKVVFLKIRRKLVERGKDGKIVRSTSEHDSPKNSVVLYEGEHKQPGVAEDLRKQFPNLRTVQIVYALLCEGPNEPELVKLIVKGASLGSEVKAKDVPTFYDYISSFKGDEHFYQFKTTLTPVKEEGKQTYFAINFQRGERLSETSYALAMERMKDVHENCVAVDTQRAMRIVKDATGAGPDIVPEGEEAPSDKPDYPTEDINPDDIPF